MNALEICRLLVTGSVDAADLPELADEEMREDIRQRLAGAGCTLAYSEATGRWVARLDGPLPAVESHDPVLRLHAAEQAMLAACWLHLRLLPLERARVAAADDGQLIATDNDEPSVDVEDLLAQFHGKLKKGYLDMVLGRLKNAGFVRQRAGRLYAGPLLDTIDEVVAGERARVLLARHQRLSYLKRRAEQIEREEGGSDVRAPGVGSPSEGKG
ncbi:MAG: hypothetical protein HY704_04360 [Gemmatimonadetes bacterium]|nr:hypothetical protein [Gemmatimonadota bacterium]